MGAGGGETEAGVAVGRSSASLMRSADQPALETVSTWPAGAEDTAGASDRGEGAEGAMVAGAAAPPVA